ncbi:5-carboxymethyl-2-hydroxymuconate isomerase [Pseudomonas sp. JH-2]|uniref:5-carboxymethyl-2-hydroxymuconate isomerase n=1 Tax=Pseudomonas sp. JH-2 TaxID=3114998 RepID=UPI002E266B22|nr:5-carboxymethyl-2-hydroxymuconate isomerase [Pseudomonas sp. JH-2]
MPHLIVEYSANLEGELGLPELFERVHGQLIESQLFPVGGIRSRARRVEVYRFADGARPYAGIHVELKLSAARPVEVRERVGRAVFATLCEHWQALQARRLVALSMEVGSFEPALFFNRNNLHPLFEAASR